MARRLITVLTLAAIGVTACAEPGPPTLADGSLESALPESIWPDDPSLVSGVDCADLDTEVIAQSTMCTATLDSEAVTVDVEIDETGAAVATVNEPLFVVADAADELASRLREDLSIDEIDVKCDQAVVLAATGRTLACEATNDGRPIGFELVLTGEADEWTIRLAD